MYHAKHSIISRIIVSLSASILNNLRRFRPLKSKGENMHDKEVEPELDLDTQIQIRAILNTSYICLPMSYDQKLALWRSIPIKSLDRGIDYRGRIMGEHV